MDQIVPPDWVGGGGDCFLMGKWGGLPGGGKKGGATWDPKGLGNLYEFKHVSTT